MKSIRWFCFLLLFISVSGFTQNDPFQKVYSIKKGRVTGPDADYRNFTLVKDQGDSLMFQRNYSKPFFYAKKDIQIISKKRKLFPICALIGASFGSLGAVIDHAISTETATSSNEWRAIILEGALVGGLLGGVSGYLTKSYKKVYKNSVPNDSGLESSIYLHFSPTRIGLSYNF